MIMCDVPHLEFRILVGESKRKKASMYVHMVVLETRFILWKGIKRMAEYVNESGCMCNRQ